MDTRFFIGMGIVAASMVFLFVCGYKVGKYSVLQKIEEKKDQEQKMLEFQKFLDAVDTASPNNAK